MLKALEASDSQNISFLFSVALQLPLTSSLHADMQHNGELAHRVFAHRAFNILHRVGPVVTAKAISDDGFHFELWQLYKIVFDTTSKHAKEIVHIPSGTVAKVPSHIVITADFVCHNGWFDATARVDLLPSSFVLHTFFAKDAAFLTGMATDKTAKQVLLNAMKNVPVAGGSSSSSGVVVSMGNTSGAMAVSQAVKARFQVRTTAARKAMAKKADERSAARCIKLTI
jgi:hypothetical protein